MPYLDVDRAELLEYDIASALGLLVRERTPRIAVLSPLVAPSAIRTGREGLSVLEELRATGDLAVVPYFADTLPADIDVVLVIDATVLKRAMLRSIDRFVAEGGTLVVLLDPFVRFNRASQRTRPTPSDELNDITDLVASFGFRFDVGEVVGDERFAAPVSIGGAGARGYPFWIRVPRGGARGVASGDRRVARAAVRRTGLVGHRRGARRGAAGGHQCAKRGARARALCGCDAAGARIGVRRR